MNSETPDLTSKGNSNVMARGSAVQLFEFLRIRASERVLQFLNSNGMENTGMYDIHYPRLLPKVVGALGNMSTRRQGGAQFALFLADQLA